MGRECLAVPATLNFRSTFTVSKVCVMTYKKSNCAEFGPVDAFQFKSTSVKPISRVRIKVIIIIIIIVIIIMIIIIIVIIIIIIIIIIIEPADFQNKFHVHKRI